MSAGAKLKRRAIPAQLAGRSTAGPVVAKSALGGYSGEPELWDRVLMDRADHGKRLTHSQYTQNQCSCLAVRWKSKLMSDVQQVGIPNCWHH
jgi:hypothetical protein